MLDRAAAADGEVRAEGCDALGARLEHAQRACGGPEWPEAASTSTVSPGQRVGNEDLDAPAIGDAVAAMADMVDDRAVSATLCAEEEFAVAVAAGNG